MDYFIWSLLEILQYIFPTKNQKNENQKNDNQENNNSIMIETIV